MAIRAKLVLADLYNYTGETDKVLGLIKPLADSAKAKKLPEDLPPGMEAQILGLGLRAYVAKKDVESAIALLDVLQKKGAEEGSIGGLAELLRDLGRQIKNQIDLLEQQGEGAKDQLQQTRDNFRVFLSKLEGDEKLPPDLRLWVGTSYVSLDDHQKAAAVFNSFKDPVRNAARELRQVFNQSQFLKLRSMRLGAAAETNKDKRKKGFEDTDRALKEMMKNPTFGKNPAFLAEEALLLQDQELYSGPNGAISKWDRLMKGLEGYVDRWATVQEHVPRSASQPRLLSLHGGEEAARQGDPAGGRPEGRPGPEPDQAKQLGRPRIPAPLRSPAQQPQAQGPEGRV